MIGWTLGAARGAGAVTTDLSAHRLAVRHSVLRSVVIVAVLFTAFAFLPLPR